MAGKTDDKAASKDDKSKKADDSKKKADDTDDTTDEQKKTDDGKKADDAAAEKPKEKTYSKSELDAAVEKGVKAALKKADDEKDLSENERLKKENEELKAANRLRDAKDSTIAALQKAGAKSPELLWKAIKDELEFDDKGSVKNLDALVTSAKSDFEDQFGEPKPDKTIDGGAGQGGKGGDGAGLTEEKIKAMTPQEINDNWDEVKAAMAKG